MTIATPARTLAGEQRIAFHNVSWANYLQIFHALPQHRNSRISYDSGILEIAMPLEEHEVSLRLIERFILALVFEMGMELKTMGSTTMNLDRAQKGAEPDCAYYIQNQPQVTGRNVDFETDPPPDLVVEVDITNTDLDKNRLYAAIGVPEFWRYDGKTWRIFVLEDGEYAERDRSPIFPIAEKGDLYGFLAKAIDGEIAAERRWRDRLRERLDR
ncbi:MAG: Uma2 family endonuclease [Geitlerinemataceae cyanobacterium]